MLGDKLIICLLQVLSIHHPPPEDFLEASGGVSKSVKLCNYSLRSLTKLSLLFFLFFVPQNHRNLRKAQESVKMTFTKVCTGYS